jgi:hypothetical protein
VMRDPFVIQTFPPTPPTPAGRLSFLLHLYRPPICDDDGNVIGYAAEGEGFIDREALMALLSEPTE